MLRLALALFCLLVVAAPAAVSAQTRPLPAPQTPDALAESLRVDPRASDGAIAFGRVAVFSCAQIVLRFEFAYIVPPGSAEPYILRFIVRQNDGVYMNARRELTEPAGVLSYLAFNETSGGAAPQAFPLSANTPTLVRAILFAPDQTPLWYTDATFDCDGSPDNVTRRNGPVTILDANPSFDTPGATGKLAHKWTFTGKVKRTCGALAGDCAVQLKGKPAKATAFSQKKNYPAGIGAAGAVWGMSMTYDTVDSAGNLGIDIELRDAGAGPDSVFNAQDVLPATADHLEWLYGMSTPATLTGPIDRVKVAISHSGAAPAGTLYVRSLYIWMFSE